MDVELVKGNIADLEVDVIVNAANKTLLGGGGVDGAIHQKAGEELLAECEDIRKYDYPDGLECGDATITKGYSLPANFIIHTVGPIYKSENAYKELRDCILNSLKVAEQHQFEVIAFPAISAGANGFPIEEVAQIFRETLKTYQGEYLNKAIICLYTDEDYKIFQTMFEN